MGEQKINLGDHSLFLIPAVHVFKIAGKGLFPKKNSKNNCFKYGGIKDTSRNFLSFAPVINYAYLLPLNHKADYEKMFQLELSECTVFSCIQLVVFLFQDRLVISSPRFQLKIEFYDHLLIPHGAIKSYRVVFFVVWQKTLPAARISRGWKEQVRLLGWATWLITRKWLSAGKRWSYVRDKMNERYGDWCLTCVKFRKEIYPHHLFYVIIIVKRQNYHFLRWSDLFMYKNNTSNYKMYLYVFLCTT